MKQRYMQAWITWLGDVIERECAKPESDMKLVEACEALLCDLTVGMIEGSLTPAAMEARLTDIKARGVTPPRRLRRASMPSRIGKLAACVALAAVVTVGAATAAVTAIPALRGKDDTPTTETTDPVHISMNDPAVTGIRYTCMEEVVDYDDVETLLVAQGLEIPYPTALPEGVSITAVDVDVTSDPATVSYGFSAQTLSMTVALNTAADTDVLAAQSEVYTGENGMTSYLTTAADGTVRATVVSAGTVTTIAATSRESVTVVLDGLAENTPVRPSTTNLAEHDGYLYYVEKIPPKYQSNRTYYTVRRLDLATGEVSNPCVTEGCDHSYLNCTLYGGPISFCIVGDWMLIDEGYYWNMERESDFSRWERRYVYNLKTGETRRLAGVLQDTASTVPVGNCLYMARIRDSLTYADGSVRNYSYIYEYNLDTGEYRIVYEHNDIITLFYGNNTRVYFYQEVGAQNVSQLKFFSLVPETGEIREETKLSQPSVKYVYRNRVYRIGYTEEAGVYAISANDAATGEVIELIRDEIPYYDFGMSEDSIYYTRMDGYAAYSEAVSALYDSYREERESDVNFGDWYDRYESERNQLAREMLYNKTYELWRYDLETGEKTRLCEFPSTLYINKMYIEGDLMYTYAWEYDPEAAEYIGESVLSVIDLKTGEITTIGGKLAE